LRDGEIQSPSPTAAKIKVPVEQLKQIYLINIPRFGHSQTDEAEMIEETAAKDTRVIGLAA